MNSHKPIDFVFGVFAKFLEIISFVTSIFSAVQLFTAWSNNPWIEFSQYLTSEDQSKRPVLRPDAQLLHIRGTSSLRIPDAPDASLERPDFGSTNSHLVVRKPTSKHSVIYPQGLHVCLGTNSESQNWLLCPSPGLPLVLFLICQCKASSETSPFSLSAVLMFFQGPVVQMFPDGWSSENRSTGHLVGVSRTGHNGTPFQCYPCVFWLYTQSLTKSLWGFTLLLAMTRPTMSSCTVFPRKCY